MNSGEIPSKFQIEAKKLQKYVNMWDRPLSPVACHLLPGHLNKITRWSRHQITRDRCFNKNLQTRWTLIKLAPIASRCFNRADAGKGVSTGRVGERKPCQIAMLSPSRMPCRPLLQRTRYSPPVTRNPPQRLRRLPCQEFMPSLKNRCQ